MSDDTISFLTDENEKLRRANRFWKMTAVGALLIGVLFTSLVGGLMTVGWMAVASRGRAQQARAQAMIARDRAQVEEARARAAAQLAAEQAEVAETSDDSPDPQ